MILYTIRRGAFIFLCRCAMAVGPNARLRMSMASESWTFGEFKLTHFPSKIGPTWTTDLRTTIRSFLFNKRLFDTVKSVDTALLRTIATISNAVKQHIAGPTLSKLSRKWPKAFPSTR